MWVKTAWGERNENTVKMLFIEHELNCDYFYCLYLRNLCGFEVLMRKSVYFWYSTVWKFVVILIVCHPKRSMCTLYFFIQLYFFLYLCVCISVCRQTGQNTAEELKSKDFRRELEEKERIAAHEREGKRASRGNVCHIISTSFDYVFFCCNLGKFLLLPLVKCFLKSLVFFLFLCMWLVQWINLIFTRIWSQNYLRFC